MKKNKGFSLLELIIYIAVFGGIVLVVSNVLVTILTGRDSTNARFEAMQNMRFASEKIRQLVFDSSTFLVKGTCPFNELEANIGGASTTISVSNGVLQIASGTSVSAITSNLVTASTSASCMFTKITNPSPAKPTLQFQLKINYNDNGNQQLKFSDEIRTTISQRQ